MHSPPVSVVVVSRDRPLALMRCLDGLAQLDYPEFEIVCVACPRGMAALVERGDAANIKHVPFDEPNISAARNTGITQAAGEIIAFIDDDAVPEPLWLRHLVSPFAEDDVAATGGYVIGRNGISFQWKARATDQTGEATDLDIDDQHPTVLHPQPGRTIKTEGTNMAVRRNILASMGGFDPAFRFYLDETDLNQRLADQGLATAIVPLAQVHHGFAESARRSHDRTPRDLTEIGASKAVFLRKHCEEKARAKAWKAFRKAQRIRLLGFMQSGPLDPVSVLRLMRGLSKGYKDGNERPLSPLPNLPRAAEGLRPYPARPNAPRHYLTGRVWQRKALMAKAHTLAAEGAIVTVCILSPTTRFHRVRFVDGIWLQTGGRFGRSTRNMQIARYWRFSARSAFESKRAYPVRGQ